MTVSNGNGRIQALDILGQRFGRLVAIQYVSGGNGARWTCRCDCGVTKDISYNSIRRGQDSCGCAQRDNARLLATKHGMARTKEYKAWASMKERCQSNYREGYVRRYQDRGIAVCLKWQDDFLSFLAHIGPAPTRAHSVDRIDNDKGYEPGNVKWSTAQQQGRNRSTNIFIEVNGVHVLLIEECERRGITPKVFQWRMADGWSQERALSTPVRYRSDKGTKRR